MNCNNGELYAVTLGLLLCASFFVFSTHEAPVQATLTVEMPKYLSTEQNCPIFPGITLNLDSSEEKRNRLDSMARILDDDMAKLHALNKEFQAINEKWNVIFSTSNAAHDTKKIGTQIRVSYHPSLPTRALIPVQLIDAIPSKPSSVIHVQFKESIIPVFSEIPNDPLTSTPSLDSQKLVPFEPEKMVSPNDSSTPSLDSQKLVLDSLKLVPVEPEKMVSPDVSSTPSLDSQKLVPVEPEKMVSPDVSSLQRLQRNHIPASGQQETDLNPSCLGKTSHDLLTELPQNESQVFLRNITERVPISSFDNETGSILEKLSPDARAELMKIAIDTDANSNLTRSIVENQSASGANDKLAELNEEVKSLNKKWNVTFSTSNAAEDTKKIGSQIHVSYHSPLQTRALTPIPLIDAIPSNPPTVIHINLEESTAPSEHCQIPPSLNVSDTAHEELCSKLSPEDREFIANKVTNTTQAGSVALPATTLIASRADQIRIVLNNQTFMDSLTGPEYEAFSSVVSKPTPQNMISFLTNTQTQPITCMNFIKIFYPPQEHLNAVFKDVNEDESDKVIKRISQDEQLSSAIKNTLPAKT